MKYAMILVLLCGLIMTGCSDKTVSSASDKSDSSEIVLNSESTDTESKTVEESSSVADEEPSVSSEPDNQEDSEGSEIDNYYIDPQEGYVCQIDNLKYINLYYERVSDHEIRTLDGKLKGSFSYEVNDEENTVIFTTTYENISDDKISADFDPSISFISDKTDCSNPVKNALFDGHTIKPGESYTFTDTIKLGEYSDVMINYVFCIQVDKFNNQYGTNTLVHYVPLGSVFPFVIHLYK